MQQGNKWVQYCEEAGVSQVNIPTIGTIVNQIEKNVQFKAAAASADPEPEQEPAEDKPKKRTSRKKKTVTSANDGTVTVNEVTDLFIKQTAFFEDAMVREQVFNLRFKEAKARAEFDLLDK